MNIQEDHIASVGVAMGEDVGALDGLWVETEDVVHAEDGDCCRRGTCYVGLQAVELDVFTLGGVILPNDGWDAGSLCSAGVCACWRVI